MADNELRIEAGPGKSIEALQTPDGKESVGVNEASDVTTNYLRGWQLVAVTIA